MIENTISRKIKAIQTDNGCEFLALTNFLKEQGIAHWRTCPSAHQQMEVVEWWHRQIVELGLALLNQAGLPLSFWHFAFATSVFLYNRTLTSSLVGSNPYEELYGEIPNVRDLHVFGCIVYPNMHPFNCFKFSNRSTDHLFIGYPNNTKGYMCYDPISGKTIIWRDVIFLEDNFFAANKLSEKPDYEELIPNSFPIGIISHTTKKASKSGSLVTIIVFYWRLGH